MYGERAPAVLILLMIGFGLQIGFWPVHTIQVLVSHQIVMHTDRP